MTTSQTIPAAASCASELARDGMVQVYPFVPVATVDGLYVACTFMMRYFADQRGRVQTSSAAEVSLCQSYDEWCGLSLGWLQEYSEERKPELPPLAEYVATAVRCALELLGEDYQFLPQCSFFRKVGDHKGGVRWHCDAEAASMLAFGDSCCSIWLPLVPVGKRLPSLQFVLGSHRLMRGRSDLALRNHRSDEWVDRLPGQRVAPIFLVHQLGGAVLFDMYTLHRTQPMSTLQPRLSCELRFARR